MITIITPTLNAAAYLPAMLATLYSQGEPFEHIVVDGGSTDSTCDLARAAGSRVIEAPGTNQSEALNIGFAEAKGSIWAWQNADDLYAPNCFRRILKHFSDPSVDVIYGGYSMIDATGNKLCLNAAPPWASWKLQYGRFVPMQPATFWRARVHCTINEARHYTMDVDMFSRMHLQGARFFHAPDTLGAFRCHGSSKTSTLKAKWPMYREHHQVLRANYHYHLGQDVLFWFFAVRGFLAGIWNKR
jgi:glycosyltransferase involved in cell wall biosynthesis